ncbi:DUF1534 domain-containing protein [Pseudomonas congelans]|nr:DUF1534 domain-containing protein [Pseudomonas congelans]
MRLSFRTLQRGNAFRDALRRKRTRSVQKGKRRRASHDSCDHRSARPSVGMHFATHCVAKRTQSVQNCMPTRSIGTRVMYLSVIKARSAKPCR